MFKQVHLPLWLQIPDQPVKDTGEQPAVCPDRLVLICGYRMTSREKGELLQVS